MIATPQCANCIKVDVCNQKEKYDELLGNVGQVMLLGYAPDGQFSTQKVRETPEFEVSVRCAHFFNVADPASQKVKKPDETNLANLANTNFAKITESPEVLTRYIACVGITHPSHKCPNTHDPDIDGDVKCKACVLEWLKTPCKADEQDE